MHYKRFNFHLDNYFILQDGDAKLFLRTSSYNYQTPETGDIRFSYQIFMMHRFPIKFSHSNDYINIVREFIKTNLLRFQISFPNKGDQYHTEKNFSKITYEMLSINTHLLYYLLYWLIVYRTASTFLEPITKKVLMIKSVI